jgi:hypothetical protein
LSARSQTLKGMRISVDHLDHSNMGNFLDTSLPSIYINVLTFFRD